MTSSGARRSAPTIRDVAAAAGVSRATASRVINGGHWVSPEARAAVEEAIRTTEYTPNHAARALRKGAFQTIGLMASRFERTGEALTTSAVIEAARAEDYGVTIVNVKDPGAEGWESAASRLSSQAIDGLVILRAEV